jgi:hypothetical protein
MRGALVVGMCLLALATGCPIDLTGKDRCQTQDDCVLGGICRDGRCLAATAAGQSPPDAAAPDTAPPATPDAPTAAQPDAASPPDAAAPPDAPPDPPTPTRPDAPPAPPDTQPDLEPVTPPAAQPDGSAQAPEAPACRPELTCCEPCTQGCTGTVCRIDIAGDDWRDFDTDGMSAGHTLSIQQIGSFFRVRYTSGPREGLEHDGRFLDQHAIDLGGVPGEVRNSRLIVFFSGEWRR